MTDKFATRHANRVVVIVSPKKALWPVFKKYFDDLESSISRATMLEKAKTPEEYFAQYKNFYLTDWVPYPTDRFGEELYDRREKLMKQLADHMKKIVMNEVSCLFSSSQPSPRRYFSPDALKDMISRPESFFSFEFQDFMLDLSKTPYEEWAHNL